MPWEGIYVVAGLVLAGYYLPQLRTCARDRDGLRAYSLPKGLVQLICRLVMMPFIWLSIDEPSMLGLQLLDLALRTAEVGVAILSLRRQGWPWGRIAARAMHRQWSADASHAVHVEGA